MKGDVKVIVSGSSGHIVIDESNLIKRILLYLISAILGFGALFLAIMMDSRAYAATFPEIFMGTFEDAYTGGDPDEIAQMPETGDVITTPRTVVILGSKWKLKPGFQLQSAESTDCKVVAGGAENRYLVDDKGEVIDIGFVIPVDKVEENIPRADYAENNLLSRMKIRQTNADIGDLSKEIESAIKRYRNNNPISIYSETVKCLSDPLKKVMDSIVDPSQFERLIKCYFERIGADSVIIPSKKDGEGEADGDIVARFDALKLVIYVQAKHHIGQTGDKAVVQISKYIDQKSQEAVDPEYNSIAWVISSAEEFSENAQALAIEKNIRLINGTEFRRMLIDAGMAKLATEFSS